MVSTEQYRRPIRRPSVLCGVTSEVTEFMVSTEQYRRPIRRPSVLLCNLRWYGKLQWTRKRNAIGHTHARASSEQAWEPMASSSVNFCRKTRTGPTGLPGNAGFIIVISCGLQPIQRGVAEFMVNRRRDRCKPLDRLPKRPNLLTGAAKRERRPRGMLLDHAFAGLQAHINCGGEARHITTCH